MWKAEEQLTEIMNYRKIITRSISLKTCRKRQDEIINIGDCFQAEIPDFDEAYVPPDRQDILIQM